MDQAAKTEILEAIESALVLLERVENPDRPGQVGNDVYRAKSDIKRVQERINELLDGIEQQLKKYSRAEPRGIEIFAGDLEDYDLHECRGLLRVLKSKTGGPSEIKLHWEGIDQQPMVLGTYTAKTDIEDVEVEALELLLEDRRWHADWARDERQKQP